MADRPILRLGSVKEVAVLRDHVAQLGLEIPCDEALLAGDASPLARSADVGGLRIGNRFAIQPMEGWDGTRDGRPTEPTVRRWANFGRSGAKLIWGGEAVAVPARGRANPNQLLINERRSRTIARPAGGAGRRAPGDDAARTTGWSSALQLTHSGRFSGPNDKDDAGAADPVSATRSSTAGSASGRTTRS